VDSDRVSRLADVLESNGFVEKCENYIGTWAPVDEEIRDLCEVRRPGHDSFQTAYPKVVIVDGAYRAGLSRCLTSSKGGTFDAQAEVAGWMWTHGHQTMESAIGAVSLRSSANSASFLRDCLVSHGHVVCELQKLGDSGKYPTSFVSKYLHFHNKDYVIYDSVVDDQMTKLLASVGGLPRAERDIARPADLTYSESYYNYLGRFRYLMEAGMSLKPDATIKQLDHFLWNAWA